MGKEISSLSILEQAWVAANVYDKSNEVAKFGGIIDTENIRTMSDWIKDPKNMGFGIDMEKAADERLMNKYVIPITVTLPGSSESLSLEVVVDSKYRDVAVISKDEEGAEKSFRLSDRIKKSINGKAELLKGQLTSDEMANLKEELEADLPSTMKELADEWTGEGRGRGDDELGPRSRKDVKEKAEEMLAEDDPDRKIDEEGMQTQEEIAKTKEAEKIIPEGQEDIIKTILESKGLNIADITQVNEVENSGVLANKAGVDDSRMSSDSNVTVIRIQNKSMDGSPDHMIVIQDNKLIETEGKDKEIGDFVDRYGGKSSGVVKTQENEAYDNLEFKADDGSLKEAKIYGNPEPSQQEAAEFIMKFRDLEMQRDAKLEEKRSLLENETDPDARATILNDIKYIQQGYAGEFRSLIDLYGIEIDDYEKDLDVRVTEAEEDRENGEDHTNPADNVEEKSDKPKNNGYDERDPFAKHANGRQLL